MDAFKPDIISERILRRLIKQDVIYQIKVKNREKGKTDPSTIIYQQGKPVNYFVLVLEGRVEVTVGREEMRFESGPFTYFGTQALTHCFGIGGKFESNTSRTLIPFLPLSQIVEGNVEGPIGSRPWYPFARISFLPVCTILPRSIAVSKSVRLKLPSFYVIFKLN